MQNSRISTEIASSLRNSNAALRDEMKEQIRAEASDTLNGPGKRDFFTPEDPGPYSYTEGIWFQIGNRQRGTVNSILGFTIAFLHSRFDEPKPIPAFHEEMWALCASGHLKVAIAAPRGHAKSTAITFAYALFLLMTRRSKHMLIISSNEEIAASFLKDIKIELQENEMLAEHFGVSEFLKDQETEIIVKFKDGGKFRVLAKGAMQRMRGLKWERKRPDYVICDDMEDDELVANEIRRDKFKKWFLGAVLPITKEGGKIRVVGTIMHLDSLLENFMPNPKDIDTIQDGLRLYSKNKKRAWLSAKYKAHNEDFSQILWPQQFNKDILLQKRQEYAEIGQLDVYGQEYLNYPIDPTTSYFRKSDFLPMLPEHFERKMTYYVGVDLAISEKRRNARTAMIVGGMDSEGFLNIIDSRTGHWDGLEIIEELFSINERYHPEIIRIEEENIARALGSIIYREMDERQHYLPISTGKPTKDKDQRAQAIRARMRAGKVRFDKSAEWYPDLEEELTTYPKHPKVDQMDALAWIGLTLEEMVNPPTPKEEEDEQYEQELEEYGEFGRNATTGY